MPKEGQRVHKMVVIETSPLRGLDPRTKLVMALCASLMVMLPLDRLLIFMAFYVIFITWAHLLPSAGRQIWKLKWVLLVLFVMDIILIDLELAVTVTLRLILLAGVFTLLFATTTPGEFTLALEHIGLPYRYSFSLGLAFQSLNLLEEEWQNIQEAQRARGAFKPLSGWRELMSRVGDLVALTVPVVVMTTKRAWAATEAAYARGFDSPHRKPYWQPKFTWLDGFVAALTLFFTTIIFLEPQIWSYLEKIL
jgi:biotin transport system permease protein